MRRAASVAVIVTIILVSSLVVYVVYDYSGNKTPQNENLEAVFYEQGLPENTFWSVTIHPVDSPSSITTLSTNSTRIVFDGLSVLEYNYSFSAVKGDLVLSYGGKNTTFGQIGTQTGNIWVGISLIPTSLKGKPIVPNPVYTLGVYYPKILAHNVGAYLNDNGTVYNLTEIGRSAVYQTGSLYNYIIDSNFSGLLTGSEYRIDSVAMNGSEYGTVVPSNPDPPIIGLISGNLTFTVNLTSLPHSPYSRVVMYGY